MPVLHAGLVFSDSFQNMQFLCVREATLHRVVGKEDDDDDANSDGDESEQEKQNLPGLEVVVGVCLVVGEKSI